MHMIGSGISLPVSVSGKAPMNNKMAITKTETFSKAFSGILSNKVLLELGGAYKNTEYKSTQTIDIANEALTLLCKYMVQNDFDSLPAIRSGHLVELMDFIRQKTGHKSTWRALFSSLRVHSSETALGHLVWPQTTDGNRDGGKTQGHSMYAYRAMGDALRKEIDRVREKKGRLFSAIEKGRILALSDLDFLSRRKGLKVNKDTDDDGLWVTRDDIICTIHQYLPGWPVINRMNAHCTWSVYIGGQGVRLGSFEIKDDAEALAAKHGANAIVTLAPRREAMNAAEILLYCISSPSKFKSSSARHLRSLFNSWSDIIDAYYPTAYDLQCFFLYWTWLTGWNVETISSVAPRELGLGIDITKHSPLELFSGDHIEIVGKAPTNESSKKKNEPAHAGEPGEAGAIITGYKTRAQPEGEPKCYTHISDKNDPYGLYCVLKDFYALTEPLRPFLEGEEKDCILVGVTRSSCHDQNRRALTMFGGPHKKAPDYGKAGLGHFFERNPIYEDEQEFFDGAGCEPSHMATDIPDAPNQNLRRLWSTSAREMRTTYETWLQYSGVPITERKLLMGHESPTTTITSYGAERVSVGMRIRHLRRLLNEVENKIFKGELRRYQHRDSVTREANKDKIVQIFTHLKSDVVICQNPKEPTWPGHEEYVEGNCTEFGECLFCKQCLVIPETLPVLVRWQRDIKQMAKAVGPVGISDKVYLLRQAIEEVFELCRAGGSEWQAAIEKAHEIAMDPYFTAPHFMYRYTTPRGT